MPRSRFFTFLAVALLLGASSAFAQNEIEPLPAPAALPSYADLLPPNPSPPPAEEVSPPAEVEAAPEPSEEAPVEGDPVGALLPGAEPVVYWYEPVYWFGPAPWDAGIEFGLNGSSGTSDSVSFRSGGYWKRSAKDYKFAGSLYYNKTQSNGVEVQSNALLDLRYDWLFEDSSWSIFLLNQDFYDEFQAFDFNVNINTGFGFDWIKTETMKLATSIGTGASREFGGPEDEWVPEAQFGFNYEWQIDPDKKFYAKTDWFPEWEDFNSGRVLSDIGVQIQLHRLSNMSLKLSATDRYDADPQGVSPHNLNYSALLIWKL